jgi:hypothetical protein
MANILDKIAQIRDAVFGKDVRENIATGIEAINTEVEITTGKQDDLKIIFDDLVINAGSENAEIVSARGGEVSLPVRLDKVASELANMATQDFITNKATLADLNLANAEIVKKRDKLTLLGQNDMTTEFIQQIAGATPVNAVVADGGVTTAKMGYDTDLQVVMQSVSSAYSGAGASKLKGILLKSDSSIDFYFSVGSLYSIKRTSGAIYKTYVFASDTVINLPTNSVMLWDLVSNTIVVQGNTVARNEKNLLMANNYYGCFTNGFLLNPYNELLNSFNGLFVVGGGGYDLSKNVIKENTPTGKLTIDLSTSTLYQVSKQGIIIASKTTGLTTYVLNVDDNLIWNLITNNIEVSTNTSNKPMPYILLSNCRNNGTSDLGALIEKDTRRRVMETIPTLINGGNTDYSGEKIILKPKYDKSLYFNVADLGTVVTTESNQGMTIFNDTMFVFYNTGVCVAIDLLTKTIINEFNLGSYNALNHANSASFGTKYFDIGDEYPLLYISECTGSHRCFVERIVNTGGVFSATLVQTLSYANINTNYANEFDWIVDNEKGFIYTYGKTIDNYQDVNNRHMIKKFKMPLLASGDVIFAESDVLESWLIEDAFPNQRSRIIVYQGHCINNGKLFLPDGGSSTTDNYLWVIDLNTHKLTSSIYMSDVASEPEDCEIYDNSLLIRFGSGRGMVYKYTF